MTLYLKDIGRKIGRQWIIKDLSLEVNQGECLALLGPSGCGKSSTLRLIAGLDQPDQGKIFINDIDVTNISPVERRIGMVFQSYALFPHLSIAKNLSLGLKVRGATEQEQRKRVNEILMLMQLEEHANRKPSNLSGGQRQRVALARALLRDPLVYLLDEPMSNLDAQLKEELRPELRRLIMSGSQPVVYVTHDQHEAMAMAQRIAVLRDGQLEQVGTTKELYNKPVSTFVAQFIGRPQINLLRPNLNTITGIRPEDLRLEENGMPCKLTDKEWLGSSQLLLLESERGPLRMLCGSHINVPERISVSWPPDKEHHFNVSNGLRIN